MRETIQLKPSVARKFFFIITSLLMSLCLGLFYSLSVGAGGEGLPSGDAYSEELRSITLESWDKDYSGAGYGWQVSTNRDGKGTKEGGYKSSYSGVQNEREVKLIKGSPLDIRENRNYEPAEILAVRFSFTFPGDNVVSIEPPHVDQYMNEQIRHYLSENVAVEKSNRPSCYKDPSRSFLRNSKRAVAVECVKGIKIPGLVYKISVWVMGRGDNYNLEAWLEDYKGGLHILPMGSLNFIGWRPLSVSIPKSIPQDTGSYPPTNALIFRKFKLRTRPGTLSKPVYVYFDELRALTKVFQTNFDGAQIDFDAVDCARKNSFYKLLRQNSRYPEQWPKLVDCSKSPRPL